MAVQSQPTELGTPLPATRLPDLDGEPLLLPEAASGRAVLVVFSCNHCPYVQHVESVLGDLVAEYDSDQLFTVAICANDAEAYPEDDAAHLREQRERAGWSFPYLIDEDQGAAREYGAVCTPDFFLYDAAHRLAYRGRLDGSTPRNGQPLTGEDLRRAIDLTLAGQPVPLPHGPAMGCSIKWKDDE